MRVGVLAIAGALDDRLDEVDQVLTSAGHTSARRFARLQTRPGEAHLRLDDVREFLDLYGHEYAVIALRGWSGPSPESGSAGAEGALVELAVARGGAVLWIPSPGDDLEAVQIAGATVIAPSAAGR